MRGHRESENHRLIGGDLCLDFANTLNGHTDPPGYEYLHDYRDLVLWSRHAGILTTTEAKAILKRAAVSPNDASNVYQRALALREAIFRIFAGLVTRNGPGDKDLKLLSTVWQIGRRHTHILRRSTNFSLDWEDVHSLERILYMVSISAVDLLTSERVKQVRQCAGEDCDWLFIDTSRNHLRRWCSMDECGNRAKMRRRQRRKKLAA